jgi:hypothetical protein
MERRSRDVGRFVAFSRELSVALSATFISAALSVGLPYSPAKDDAALSLGLSLSL